MRNLEQRVERKDRTDYDALVTERMTALGYWDDESDSSGGNSELISSIIGAATSIGTTAIVASQAPGAIAQNSYIPGAGNAAPQIFAAQTQAKSSNLIIFVVLIIAAFLGFKALEK